MNARARNTHVEATLNHPCAAQVFAVAWSETPGHDERQRFRGAGCLASLDIHGFLRLWDVPLRACVRWFRARASARTSKPTSM